MEKNIPRIVLTGGPCAGKTTAKSYIQERLGDYGFYPFFVPESATILIGGGVVPVNGHFTVYDFQSHVMGNALELEARFLEVAQNIDHPKPVLIFDRGIIDARAYCSEELFQKLLERYKLKSLIEARDERYDAVFHLRSTACGAEEFYTKANNTARRENVDEARDADARTEAAWKGHPHHLFLDNRSNFDGKMKRLLAGICRVLAIPAPLEIERKYLVQSIDRSQIPKDHATVEIEQFYLFSINEAEEVRVRRRTQYGASVYYETHKRDISSGKRHETEHHITKSEYDRSRRFQEPATVAIHKHRTCFNYREQNFELDDFTGEHTGLMLLELELTEENDSVDLPPWIDAVDVTDDPRFSNHSLAKSPCRT